MSDVYPILTVRHPLLTHNSICAELMMCPDGTNRKERASFKTCRSPMSYSSICSAHSATSSAV